MIPTTANTEVIMDMGVTNPPEICVREGDPNGGTLDPSKYMGSLSKLKLPANTLPICT